MYIPGYVYFLIYWILGDAHTGNSNFDRLKFLIAGSESRSCPNFLPYITKSKFTFDFLNSWALETLGSSKSNCGPVIHVFLVSLHQSGCIYASITLLTHILGHFYGSGVSRLTSVRGSLYRQHLSCKVIIDYLIYWPYCCLIYNQHQPSYDNWET